MSATGPSEQKQPKAASRRTPTDVPGAALAHAVRLIHHVCCLAGSATLIDDLRTETRLRSAIRRADTAAVFDLLVSAFGYQGISDRVAADYMDQHGRVTWAQINRDLARRPSCPKLQSYWQFHGCRYDKGSRTCAEPCHLPACPVPTHNLRNGRLNQNAYSLFLFVRDVADGDLVGWIDRRLQAASDANSAGRHDIRAALVQPLTHVYGVSDKSVTMALSSILIDGPANRPHWTAAGLGLVVVDTLVHNFLHRTGILARFQATHPYGPRCYGPGGCAEIIERVAEQIDARKFNATYPRVFPRFVQHAIWRYCAQQGRDICNGNRIDDRKSCQNVYCQLYSICDRICLQIHSM